MKDDEIGKRGINETNFRTKGKEHSDGVCRGEGYPEIKNVQLVNTKYRSVSAGQNDKSDGTRKIYAATEGC